MWEGTQRTHRISFRKSRYNAAYEEQDSSALAGGVKKIIVLKS